MCWNRKKYSNQEKLQIILHTSIAYIQIYRYIILYLTFKKTQLTMINFFSKHYKYKPMSVLVRKKQKTIKK